MNLIFCGITIFCANLQPPIPGIGALTQNEQNLNPYKPDQSANDYRNAKQTTPAIDQQDSQITNGNNRNEGGIENTQRSTFDYSNIWLIGLNTLLVVVAICQMCIMRRQSRIFADQCRIMDDQNKIMIEQKAQTKEIIDEMRLEKRPWLGVSAKQELLLIPGRPINGMLSITNTGETPAFVVNAVSGTYECETNSDCAAKVHEILERLVAAKA